MGVTLSLLLYGTLGELQRTEDEARSSHACIKAFTMCADIWGVTLAVWLYVLAH